MRLSALSPFGPIFGKELRVTARRKRTYILRVGYLGMLLLFMLLVYSSTQPDYQENKIWMSQRQAQLGWNFFLCFAMFCVISMSLLGPILTATAINAERLNKTLPVLLMTPINVWQIVAGKLFSRLWIAISLIGLSLPVLALVRLLGGVEISQMMIVIALCLVQVMIGAAIGLFCSALMNRAYAVILLSYMLFAAIYFLIPGTMMAMIFANSRMGPGTRVTVETLWALNPIVNCAMIASGQSLPFGGDLWKWCIGGNLLISAGLVAGTGLILRRHERRAPVVASSAIPAPPIPGPMLSSPALPNDEEGVRISQRKDREVYDNPVLWRELRRPLMSKRWQAVVGSLAVIGLLLFSYVGFYREMKSQDTQIGYSYIFNALLWLMTAVISATCVATEHESDTWTLLLTTPLSPRQIVMGKFLGLARRMMWPMLLVVGHFVIFVIAGVVNIEQVGLALWLMLTVNALWLGTGIYLSLRCKRTIFAVVLNLLLAFGIYLIPWLLLSVYDGLNAARTRVNEYVAAYLPYFHFAEIFDRLNRKNDYPGYYGAEPITIRIADGIRLNETEYVLFVLAVGLGYALVTAGILWFTIRRFNRMVGRAPQG